MADQADPAEHPHPAVGSVAVEAARLLDALGGWVSTSGHAATTPDPEAPHPGTPDPEATDHEADPEAAADGAPAPDGTGAHAPGHCQHCGARSGTGQAVACQWCPVCQGIGLLRSVRPETVDRLADLAGALASALREVASHTRTSATTPPKASAAQATHDGRARGPRVQDITIEDEDQGSATR